MSKTQKNTSILSYFAKQERKESTEIKEHEQVTNSSRPICSTSASQSTEFDSAEERINLDRPNIASDGVEIYCFRYLSHLIDSNPHICFLSHTLQLLGNFPAYYFLQHNSTNYANRLFLFALKLLHSLVDGRLCRRFRLSS